MELRELWQKHNLDSFPKDCAGKEIFGVDLVMLDADIAGLATHILAGSPLSPEQRMLLARLLKELEFVVPNVPGRAQGYFTRLAEIAKLL